MMIHSVEHTFVYIDPNQKYVDNAVEGDGSSINSVLWDFPKTNIGDNKIYLIRRSANKYYATATNNTSSSEVRSLVIWAMPKPTDSWWNLVPAEARTAWLDTDKDKAYLLFNRDYSYITLNFPYCKNLDLRGFVFWSNGDSRNQAALNVGSSTGYCNVYSESVHFKNYAADFTQGQSPDYNHGGHYLYIGNNSAVYGYSAKFVNCTIDAIYNDWMIYLGRQQYIDIENCTINHLQSSDCTGVFNWGSDEWIAPYVSIKNCNVWFYMWSGRDHYMHRIFQGDVTTIHVDNVNVGMAPTQYWTPPGNNTIYIRNVFEHNVRSPGSVLKNINIDFSEHLTGGYNSFIYLEYRQGSNRSDRKDASFGQYTIVKDCNILMSRNPLYSTGENTSGGYIWNSGSSGMITLTRYDRYDRVASSDYMVQNLNIVAPRGIALSFTHALVDMKDCNIEGSCYFAHCVGKIGAISTWFPGYAINDAGGNILYIKSITSNRNNPNWEFNGQHALLPSYRSNILCGSTNTPYMPSSFQGTGDERSRNSYICTNDQKAGNYTVRNSFSTCVTWSINRVGSVGGCSLKLTNETTDDTNFPLLLGGEPFKGISSQVTAGQHVATIYLTMYGYNDFSQIADKFRCRITRPDGTMVFSSINGNWSQDNESVWENVEGSTSYRLDIPFTMDEAGEIEFEYQFSWYMKGASTYLDPYPSIS